MKSLLKEIKTKFTEQDQDSDGDNDFADIMITRMMKSGMSREDAIKKVKEKEYNEAVVIDKNADPATVKKAQDLASDTDQDLKVEGLRGALDEPYYIEVSLRDARKALNLFADKKNGYPEVTIYGSNVFASFNQDEIEDLLEDFNDHIIEILDSTTEWQGDFRNPEPDEDIDEASTSAAAGPYNTPTAFSTPEQAQRKKKMKYTGVAESLDKKYEELIESYRQFSTSNPKMSAEQKVKHTIKEMSRQLREVERTIEYTHRMKSESGIARESYGAAVQKALSEMSLRLNKISEKVRALGE